MALLLHVTLKVSPTCAALWDATDGQLHGQCKCFEALSLLKVEGNGATELDSTV